MRLPLIAFVLALAACSTARAATVTATVVEEWNVDGKGSSRQSAVVDVVAGPGERNQLALSAAQDPGARAVARVADAGGTPLTPGPGCRAETDGAVSCSLPFGIGFAVDVGDGDDAVALGPGQSVSMSVDGGPGDDTLSSGPWPSTLLGGEGDDQLSGAGRLDGGPGDDVLHAGAGGGSLLGGDGADRLAGGDGDDTLDGGAGPDVLTGGPGTDTASYLFRTAPVTVALGDTTDNGEAGEGDALGADVEAVEGGRGDDRLTGTAGADQLTGGIGDDLLEGLAGDDLIGGGDYNPGGYADHDTIAAGPGADRVVAGGGSADLGAGDDAVEVRGAAAVDGGTGTDAITVYGTGGTVRAADGTAETVACLTGSSLASLVLDGRDFSYGCLGADLRRTAAPVRPLLLGRFTGGRRSALVRVLCADDARRSCVVHLVAAVAGRRAGHVTARVSPGRSADVRVPYDEPTRRRLAGVRGRVTLAFVATMRDAGGRRGLATQRGCVRPGPAQPTRCGP